MANLSGVHDHTWTAEALVLRTCIAKAAQCAAADDSPLYAEWVSTGTRWLQVGDNSECFALSEIAGLAEHA